MSRVYISGPITGVDDYLIKFEKAKRFLITRGYFDIVNPAQVCVYLPASFTHSEYMKVCMAMLECCDTIYMLDGWEKSEGAKAECEWAMFHNYKIMSEAENGKIGRSAK